MTNKGLRSALNRSPPFFFSFPRLVTKMFCGVWPLGVLLPRKLPIIIPKLGRKNRWIVQGYFDFKNPRIRLRRTNTSRLIKCPDLSAAESIRSLKSSVMEFYIFCRKVIKWNWFIDFEIVTVPVPTISSNPNGSEHKKQKVNVHINILFNFKMFLFILLQYNKLKQYTYFFLVFFNFLRLIFDFKLIIFILILFNWLFFIFQG